MKQPSKSSIEKQCLDLWSKCVRTQQKTCRMCGSDQRLQGHHIRSRNHAATRYNLSNGLCLCSKCHIVQKFNPERFQDKVIEVIGNEAYQRLKECSFQVWKWTAPMLIELKGKLKEELRRLEDEWGTP